MLEVCCDSCGGTGKARRGTMVGPVDPDYDWLSGFASYCCSDERKAAMAAEAKDLMLSLKPGDEVVRSGQFSKRVVEVGMYDGWPYWRPVPAVSYVGPLGSIEYAFFNDLSRPWRATA
jgi:hypothetical protein